MRFIDRLTEITDGCINLKLGEWQQNGTVFYIYNIPTFKNFIKPYVFATFTRQLNFYRFTISYIKSYSKSMSFQHSNFTRDLKGNIERKQTVITSAIAEKRKKLSKIYRERKKKLKIEKLIDSDEEEKEEDIEEETEEAENKTETETETVYTKSLKERIDNVAKKLENIREDIDELIKLRDICRENEANTFLVDMINQLSSLAYTEDILEPSWQMLFND